MEWPLVLVLIFGGLVLLMVTGLPIAFCFLLINLVGVYIFWGGEIGLCQGVPLGVFISSSEFPILPVVVA